jgi:hypothetical protein
VSSCPAQDFHAEFRNRSVKLRAAQRAIDKRAPFHRQRNGIDDAILIEVYADMVSAKATPGSRFAFVTHNIKDFSHPTANNKAGEGLHVVTIKDHLFDTNLLLNSAC